MTLTAFENLIAAIEAQGFPQDEAEDIAAAIGDLIPDTDATGRWIVRDEKGREMARVTPVDFTKL